jgi:hypothetical protein
MTQAQVIVLRYPSEPDWTLSEFMINGQRLGCGVEDEDRSQKVHGETRVPNGLYELDLRHSPKFSKHYFVDDKGFISPTKDARFTKEHPVIWVKDVPNFLWVLWHWGNTDDDTDGCYIVGSNFYTFNGQKGVSGSRVKYTQVYPLIWKMINDNHSKGLATFIEYMNKPIIA